ncbi:SlyX family protein [Aquabacterium sp. OR-4]|uniref:SlyX family protein n=1 Tax=Aquabacterium sp. OR-4 TaxID=2978127 RepID=UPI0021B19F0A|nr:SlyX family protein [Aquabacterium sp. OR-4]MDT7838471.1 SlyX family protein [Aquabacterium sp. OR-4]
MPDDLTDLTDPIDPTDHRLTELEIKLSYAEDALDRLNEVIVRQQTQIDALVREVLSLRSQAGSADAGSGAMRSLRDELPPHY